MVKVTLNGMQFDWDVVGHHMDDEIREDLHSRRDWESEQQFLDAYCEAHAKKFGEKFAIN